ncbi:MAG TPA: RecX family transcriptional regulator [Stellaceae bacterium]|nr:RecX family transcriptional regulator [Stellaceae bacterium]
MSEGEIDRGLLERWALFYLARFSSSAENLRRVLLRRTRPRAPLEREGQAEWQARARALIDGLVAEYQQKGLIDDRAYAAGRARSLLRRGASASAILAKLRAKGVAPEIAAGAVGALKAESGALDLDLAAAIAFARRRRLGPYRRAAAERAKELAAFARAGFARRVAERVLACEHPDAAEAMLREGRE